jgi:hypothetical protein
MPSGFIPNPGFEKLLSASQEYVDGLAESAEPGAEAAKAIAPVASGAYRDGIEVRTVGRNVFLSGTDWKSWLIEAGTVKTPVFAPLRRGAQTAGLKFKPGK